ncbi:hypothetical protein AGR5A_Lc70271 [Agrobacterium genomosp. 5 str. CFBP 6626]|nr:hypothetical protein AGR5A_Lc70271 [Agrobacterium genomosp. 5 str. CFBP 6626]
MEYPSENFLGRGCRPLEFDLAAFAAGHLGDIIHEEGIIEDIRLAGVAKHLQFTFAGVPEVAPALTLFEVGGGGDLRTLKLLGAADLAAICHCVVLDAADAQFCALLDGEVSPPPDNIDDAQYLCHRLKAPVKPEIRDGRQRP